MLGIAVLLIISWLLLYLIQKVHLNSLGLLPDKKISIYCLTGFILAIVLSFFAQFAGSFINDSRWILNDEVKLSTIGNAIWWDAKSVLTEELLFRGAILYILIARIGPGKSILISAISFGIYHWFSYGLLGNVVPMVLIFVGSGLMGYAWALAFSRTGSILLPFVLHLGWNLVQNIIFSKGPLGKLVLLQSGGHNLSTMESLGNYFIGMILIPALMIAWIHFCIKTETQISGHHR